MKTRISIIVLLVVYLINSKPLFAESVSVYALDAMPYCGLRDGKPVGIAVDVLNSATRHGAPHFEFIFNIPWLRATMWVQESKGELVAIIPFTRSSVREHKFKWVAEIMATEYRFYTHDRPSPIESIDDIKNEVVGVVHGHAIIPMIQNMGLRIDSGAKTAYKNTMKMLNKRFNIIADSDVIAVYSWKQLGQDTHNLQVGPSIGDIKHVYIAAGPNFPNDIAKRISDAVNIMKDNGELQQIYDKWL